jgi:5-methylcytosine-specific restriction endonuclease McrA
MLEALDFALEEALHRHDPIEKAKRAKLLPAPQYSSRNGKRVAIPATVKHEVALRDGGQCTFQDAQGKRCTNRKWTEIHHRVPVSRGGLNAAANLATLCSAHHRMVHYRQ